MYNYTNEAGELLIDAAALRFEDSLDEQSARERYDEDFYAGADYEPDPCDYCDEYPEDCECVFEDEPAVAEDAWLDGYWEE